MKRSSTLLGVAIVSVVIFALLALFSLIGHLIHPAADPGRSWNEFARHAQQGYPHWMEERSNSETGGHSAWLVLLRLTLLAGGALLFLKAGGLLRWIGAAFAALGTWSLLGPVWGSLALVAVYLLYKRMTSNQPHTTPLTAGVYSSPIDDHDSRGRFLDEWERKQFKEE